MADEFTKVCTGCGQVKSILDFHHNRARKDGLQTQCKDCVRKYNRSRTGKDAQEKYRKSDKFKEVHKRYRQSTKGKAARKRSGKTRRTRIKYIQGSLTDAEWQTLLATYDYCSYCGEDLSDPQLEHILPVSRGGRHELGNVLPVCLNCNRDKGDQTLEEWLKELQAKSDPRAAWVLELL